MSTQTAIGAWRIDWQAGWIRPRLRPWAARRYPDARLLTVLQLLAERKGEIVPAGEILAEAWPGRIVSSDSVSTAIYQLRQLLGDDSHRARYIKTEPRRGYRLIAPVRHVSSPQWPASARRAGAVTAALAVLAVAGIAANSERQALLLVEPMLDQTADASSATLHQAIEATLLGELVNQLPGQVVLDTSRMSPAYTLQSAIVACDLGPALLVKLVASDDSRFVWAQAYRLEEWAGGVAEPTLVQAVANDVGGALRDL